MPRPFHQPTFCHKLGVAGKRYLYRPKRQLDAE